MKIESTESGPVICHRFLQPTNAYVLLCNMPLPAAKDMVEAKYGMNVLYLDTFFINEKSMVTADKSTDVPVSSTTHRANVKVAAFSFNEGRSYVYYYICSGVLYTQRGSYVIPSHILRKDDSKDSVVLKGTKLIINGYRFHHALGTFKPYSFIKRTRHLFYAIRNWLAPVEDTEW